MTTQCAQGQQRCKASGRGCDRHLTGACAPASLPSLPPTQCAAPCFAEPMASRLGVGWSITGASHNPAPTLDFISFCYFLPSSALPWPRQRNVLVLLLLRCVYLKSRITQGQSTSLFQFILRVAYGWDWARVKPGAEAPPACPT